MKITVWASTEATGFNQVELLRSLGYRVVAKPVSGNAYFNAIADSRNRAQIGFTGWAADYPTASDFFANLLGCASFHPRDPNSNGNFSEFATRGSTS